MLNEEQARALAAMGDRLGPETLEACAALFDAEQRQLASRIRPAATDLSYGPHERHRLDLYRGQDGSEGLPVLLFVHGGGFVLGDKGGTESWRNGNVGRMAAEAGFVGAVMNYRLAPSHIWPAGSEDIGAAVDWLRANAALHGGDPEKIFLIGTSAGAVHVATYLKLRPDARQVRGVILFSGLYGFTPLEDRDLLYYGKAELYADRRPREAVIGTDIPMLVACSQYDPRRFQAEFLALLQARLDARGQMPRACIISGHNHYSLSMHLGTADRRMADEIASFVRQESSR